MIQIKNALIWKKYVQCWNNQMILLHFRSTDLDEMCTFYLSLGYHPKDEAYFEIPTSCAAESPKFSLCDFPDMLGKC